MAVAGGVLDRVLAADVDAHAGVELEGLAAGGGLGVAEHDADLLADLVGEDAGGFGLGEDGGELAQGLAHQPRLHAHGGHAHLALEFGLGHQRGHGVDHDDVQRVGPGEGLADGQGLLAAVGLRDEQVIQVHPQFLGVRRGPGRARRR